MSRRPWTSYNDVRGALESEVWKPEEVEYIPLDDNQKADHFAKMRTSSTYGDAYLGNRLPEVNDISNSTDFTSYNHTQVAPETEFSKRQKMFDYYQDLARQIYQRKLEARNPIPQIPPMARSGRSGAPWRHVRQCTGNLGQHITFIDGVVKQADTISYPPYGFVIPEIHNTGRVMYRSAPPKRYMDNVHHQHAKNGFKYWMNTAVPTNEWKY